MMSKGSSVVYTMHALIPDANMKELNIPPLRTLKYSWNLV